MTEQEKKKQANRVLIVGTLFNLTIGVLYAWSEIKKVLHGGWGWTTFQAGLPFNIAIVCFALGVLIGGKIQDRIGPRWVVTAGGFFVGLGLVISAFVGNNPSGIALSFGVITGLGIGFGYSSVAPPALKWFHPSQKGMVNGFIIGGLGFATIFYAPLVASMLKNFREQSGYDVAFQNTFLYLGIAIGIISVTIAQFVKNPPAGHVPVEPKNLKQVAKKTFVDFTWREMIKTKIFYIIVILFLFSTTVGLMLISNVSTIAEQRTTVTNTAILVSLLALMNGTGRMLGGILSDKIGRPNTLSLVLCLQMANMIGFYYYSNIPSIIVGIIVGGLCFGSLMTVFPSMTADQFGLKSYGVNYGIIYQAWGLAGVVAPVFTDIIKDTWGNYDLAFLICAAIMPVLITINFMLKKEINIMSSSSPLSHREEI